MQSLCVAYKQTNLIATENDKWRVTLK